MVAVALPDSVLYHRDRDARRKKAPSRDRSRFARWHRLVAPLLISTLGLSGCSFWSGTYWAHRLHSPAEYATLQPDAQFAKAHLRDGGVVVLQQWWVDKEAGELVGTGQSFDKGRRQTSQPLQPFRLKLADVQLIESTNPQALRNSGVMVLGIALGLTAAVGLVCLASQKSCFGSCPTVYAGGRAQGPILAEGFSASVAKVLEATDVDPLPGVRAHHGEVLLTLTNEALETHAVRWMDLLAFELPPDTALRRDGEQFLALAEAHTATACQSSVRDQRQGDCLREVAAQDDVEWLSLTDGKDLATRETLTVQLPAVAGPAALTMTVRNSLLNTFLFYQAWAWLGTRADDWLMTLERAGAEGADTFHKIDQALGVLTVEVQAADGRWLAVGAYDEIGPIAKEHVAMRLPPEAGPGPWTVRLTAARGNYRIDALGVAKVAAELQPRSVPVNEVRDMEGERNKDATRKLVDRDDYLLTYPGDAWQLHYRDEAATPQTQYLLASRGWYVEWQQPGWVGQQDELKFVRLLTEPATVLRELAPAFKEAEPNIEHAFWSSRFRRGAR